MTKLCPRGKAAAKRKFAVYPSAYANAYASKICAGKIKDPSGTKRKDFKGPKPAKAMGGRVGFQDGTPKPKKISPSERKNTKLRTPSQADPREKFVLENMKSKNTSRKRIKRAGGGLMEATQRLRRQGLKGGGLCVKGMNREAFGKNS